MGTRKFLLGVAILVLVLGGGLSVYLSRARINTSLFRRPSSEPPPAWHLVADNKTDQPCMVYFEYDLDSPSPVQGEHIGNLVPKGERWGIFHGQGTLKIH